MNHADSTGASGPDHAGPAGDGRRGDGTGGGVPPRPETPPQSASVSATRNVESGWDQTRSLPHAVSRDHARPHPTGPSSPGPHGGGQQRGTGSTRRTVGVGTLIAGMLLAGLAGGGVAVGVNAAATGNDPAPSAPAVPSASGDVQERGHGLDINRTEGATAVTAAAAKAAPSVVTLSVSDGQGSGSGSGVILDQEGHILTNTHVVTLGGQSGSADVTVQTSDGTVHGATVVGTDPESDLAVVKIEAEGLTPIEVGDSSALNVGDSAIAIGAPLGLSGTVTDGIVSKLNRTISVASSAVPEQAEGGEDGSAPEFEIPGFPSPQRQQQQGSIYINVIQTDAAINPGNSGGALVDAEGRLIGINVAIASAGGSADSSGNIGVGFSIPIDHAQRVAQDLIRDGEATHGFLGVSVTPEPAVPDGSGASTDASDTADGEGAGGLLDREQASSGGFSAGARVVEVVADSPAAEAGLQEGDVITGVGDRTVADSQSLTAVVREYPEGGTATVHFTRDGQEQSAEVTFVSDANASRG